MTTQANMTILIKRGDGQLVKEPMVGDVDVQINGSFSKLHFKNAYHNQIALKDFSSRVGNLKSVTLFNADTNEPISKTRIRVTVPASKVAGTPS